MKINSSTGLFEGVRWCPSPHQDDRPLNTIVDLLVIHAISLPEGSYGTPYIDALFCGTLDKGLKVSAHLCIKRDGTLTQYVPLTKRAWHAGKSCYQGKTACNDFSIGIELEGTSNSPFEATQYQVLSQVTRAILYLYPKITFDRIVGHSDIAPKRKFDPGRYFDWVFFKNSISV